MFRSIVAAASLLILSAGPVMAGPPSSDQAFFQSVQGEWAGAGEIVAGKYKGTKFNCKLAGVQSLADAAMTIGGTCRVGIFSQRMEAKIHWAKGGYRGAFLDGALGKGLDIIGGNVGGSRAIFTLKRNELNGAMLARVTDGDKMTITISVRVGDGMVPVIGLGLNRIDAVTTSSVR
ncbi:hypothetical protein B7H23_13795 [Notoacmeibacter marinus]|uniref:Uncharacterized protein n=1 Tax=Notoacmeibacter marinus TaxID=1876515 RepID=A0A231UTK2_9HYPH|nr:hypothetical protein [Notoacmeibacter marinus]OXS99252.1 hypothetical protein B7H23_13795 [Notoacmeibacter marinus]